MAYSSFFEEDGIISKSLDYKNIPQELLLTPPLAETKFLIKIEGKQDSLTVRLFPDVLAIYGQDGACIRCINLSFVKANYNIEDNSNNKYRIDLVKFHNVISLYTDKLDKVQFWMNNLSKYCINYEFFSKYTLHECLGQGAFGTVHRVTLTSTPTEEYAAKIIDKKSIKRDYKRLLFMEIQILQLLNNEHIIKIHEVHETSDEIVVVMELMKCGLLSDFIQNTPKISPVQIKAIMEQILQGLKYMDSVGVIHRDIKPANILIKEFQKIGNEKIPILKIADMGLSCFAGEEIYFEMAGTHGYMAPEVFSPNLRESGALTARVDVFSAGVIFYYMITKRSPFKTSEDTPIAKANELGKISYDSMYITKFPKEGIDLLKRMLEPKYKLRISAKGALEHEYFHDDDGMLGVPSLKMKSFSPGGSHLANSNSSKKLSASPDVKAAHTSKSDNKDINKFQADLANKIKIKKMRSKSFDSP